MALDRIRNQLVNNFYDNSVMLNVAMNLEAFLCDEAIIYPYANWSKGEIISGPAIEKYHVSVILRYPFKEMPDPEGGLVLTRFGVKVFYKKFTESVLDKEESKEKNSKIMKDETSWLVKLVIPKDLITDENQSKELSLLDELLDIETIEDANQDNMDETSNFDMGGGGSGGFAGGGGFGGDDFGGDAGEGFGNDMGAELGDEMGGEDGPFDADDVGDDGGLGADESDDNEENK